MGIYAYLRVSTDQQTESGAGMDAQKEACELYAKRMGAEIIEFFKDEGFSGSLPLEKRPNLFNAISVLKKDDILLVAKRDRLGRDLIGVAMIESAVCRKGAKIISAAGEGTENNDPSSILMRRMIDAFSEYERLIIGVRTKAALQSKKKNKERVGYIPFGYKLAKDKIHIEENKKEKDVIKLIQKLKNSGFTIRGIAEELNDTEAFNRNRSKWNHASVHRISKKYAM